MNFVPFFKNFLKRVRALRVNEVKVSSKNVFIDNLLAIKSETGSKNETKDPLLRLAVDF